MAELTPLYMDVSGAYSGDELGLPYRDIMSEGVVGAGDLAVTQHAAGANLSVDIAAGAAWILGDTDTNAQPCYRVRNDAVVNKGITPDPSNPRKVVIVGQITDQTFAGTSRQWQITAIHGTPNAVPVEPALPASAIKLAVITVPAAATTIVTANIADARVRSLVGGGQAAGPAGGMSLICDQVLTVAQASFDTNAILGGNIPQTYKHLKLVAQLRGDAVATSVDVNARLNNDSGATYSTAYSRFVETARADGIQRAATSAFLSSVAAASATAGEAGVVEAIIQNYTGATLRKQITAEGGYVGATSSALVDTVSTWQNPAAVTRVAVMPGSGNFVAGSRFTLYGWA